MCTLPRSSVVSKRTGIVTSVHNDRLMKHKSRREASEEQNSSLTTESQVEAVPVEKPTVAAFSERSACDIAVAAKAHVAEPNPWLEKPSPSSPHLHVSHTLDSGTPAAQDRPLSCTSPPGMQQLPRRSSAKDSPSRDDAPLPAHEVLTLEENATAVTGPTTPIHEPRQAAWGTISYPADTEPFPPFGVYGSVLPLDTSPNIAREIAAAMSEIIESPKAAKQIPMGTRQPTLKLSASSESIALGDISLSNAAQSSELEALIGDEDWECMEKEEADELDMIVIRAPTPISGEWQRDSEGMTKMRWDCDGNPVVLCQSCSVNEQT